MATHTLPTNPLPYGGCSDAMTPFRSRLAYNRNRRFNALATRTSLPPSLFVVPVVWDDTFPVLYVSPSIVPRLRRSARSVGSIVLDQLMHSRSCMPSGSHQIESQSSHHRIASEFNPYKMMRVARSLASILGGDDSSTTVCPAPSQARWRINLSSI